MPEWIGPALATPGFVLELQPPAQPHRCVAVECPIRLADGAYLEVVRPNASARPGSFMIAPTRCCDKYAKLRRASLQQPSLRLLLNSLYGVCLFLKSENRIDFTAAPHDADEMALSNSKRLAYSTESTTRGVSAISPSKSK